MHVVLAPSVELHGQNFRVLHFLDFLFELQLFIFTDDAESLVHKLPTEIFKKFLTRYFTVFNDVLEVAEARFFEPFSDLFD